MQRLVYILAYPFLWLISILPYRLFYFFSDLVYFLVYRVGGYRKKVVYTNLRLVFPDKSEKEIKYIQKAFYKHMCDMFLETIKTLNISEEELKKRYALPNIDLLLDLEKERSIIIMLPHYGNWEWSLIANVFLKSKGFAVYQNISNVYFDRLIKKIRSIWSTTLISQRETVITMARNYQKGIRGVYGIVSDQSPQAHLALYWTEFMNI